ncbi:MAG: VTT domain-containing protein [Azospirillaceae bacterium]|nr:VTT domain-containing protein [Azospirillaceae bacterium]
MTKQRIFIAIVVVLIGIGLLAQHQWSQEIAGAVETALQYLRGLGTGGLVATVCVQFLIATSGIIPASILGIAAGAAYGMAVGFAVSATGVVAGALAAFLLSRSIFRPRITHYLLRRAGWHNFDRAIARDGWRFVCLIRLSPIMPFAIASYTLGLSSIRLRDYLIGTCASLPALGLYVFAGTLAQAGVTSLTSSQNPWSFCLLAIGGIATLALCLRIGQLAMKASAKSI